MPGRKPKNEPQTQAEMIETARQAKKTKLYKAESQQVSNEAISKSITNAITDIKRASKSIKVNLDDTVRVKAVTEMYLETCANESVFPSMSSLALCLGHTRRNLYYYMERKPETETGKFLIQLHDLFSSILAENSLRNNANGIVAIFLLKSLYGFKDTTTIELSKEEPTDTLTIDDIVQRAGLLGDDD